MNTFYDLDFTKSLITIFQQSLTNSVDITCYSLCLMICFAPSAVSSKAHAQPIICSVVDECEDVRVCLKCSCVNYKLLTALVQNNLVLIMEEVKKISFSTLGPCKTNGEKVKKSKAIRIHINLPESNAESCPEYNYGELVAQYMVGCLQLHYLCTFLLCDQLILYLFPTTCV